MGRAKTPAVANSVNRGTTTVSPDSWSKRRVVTFDVETTGVDVHEDRILTASISFVDADGTTESHDWLINPGVEIPEESIGIHGVTQEEANKGKDPAEAVDEMIKLLAEASDEGLPVVAYNARFDISILHHEAKRNGLSALEERATPLVVDPFVIDKQVDKFRRGSRRLANVCKEYGVDFDEDAAHDAHVDSIGAAKLAIAICERHADKVDLPLEELVEKQKEWAREQAVGLSEYLTKKHGKAITIDPNWPLT